MRTIDDLINAPADAHGVLVAGPGAGKTFTIGRRVDALEARGISASEIVLLTLTNATARTLRARFPAVPVRTLHAYALTTLDKLGAGVGKRVADPWEQKELVRRDIQRLSELAGHRYRITAIDDFLKAMGEGFRTGQDEPPELTPDEANIRAAWLRVREFLALRVFDEFAADLEQQLNEGRDLPDPPRAIVVDEYQDLTPVELELIRLLSRTAGAGVFACGDDLQSIYGFRGADPAGLSNFPGVYEVDEPAYLSESRRCPRTVIELAEEVAARMPSVEGMAERPRMTSHEERGEGGARLLTFPSPTSEARWIVSDIARRRAADDLKTIAVIVPRNLEIYVALLQAAAHHRGIDLTFVDSRDPLPLATNREFRLAFALLRLAADGDDELAWRTVLEIAPGQRNVRRDHLYAAGASRLSVAIRSRAGVDDKIAALVQAVNTTADELHAAANREEAMAAVEAGCARFAGGPPDWHAMIALLDEPVTAEEDVGAAADEPWRELLTAARRAARQVAGDRKPEEKEILVYTVFQAKGQEWDHVYLAGAYEQGFRDQHRLGEGSRLLYVAITRARDTLTISKPNSVGRRSQLSKALGTSSPAFLAMLIEAARAAGIQIETMGSEA